MSELFQAEDASHARQTRGGNRFPMIHMDTGAFPVSALCPFEPGRGDKRYDVTVNVRNLPNATYIESPGNLSAFNIFGAPITAIASLRVFF